MDRGDVRNALQLAGITEEVNEWLFEAEKKEGQRRPSVIVRKEHKK